MQRKTHARIGLSALASAWILTACATTPHSAKFVPLLANQPTHQIDDIEFLSVTDPMKAFVDDFAPPLEPRHKRAWSLSYAMMDPYVMPFNYDASVTLPAAETFRHRTGNCLSFSAMFVAMAREAGLKAWFQEVKVPPQWTNIDETYLVSKHVNAVVESRGSNFVVDVSGTRRDEWLDARKISDNDAFAQLYNNLGASALIRQNLPEAYAYFVKALELEPKSGYLWSNLAVVFSRNGQTDQARYAYLTALEYSPQESTALNNLHQLYSDQGDFTLAAEMEYRVEKYRSKNPWYMYHLSVEAVDEKRYSDAVDYLQKAISLNGSEYRFHLALAKASLLNGDTLAAEKSLDQARRMAPDESNISRTGLNQLLLNVDS